MHKPEISLEKKIEKIDLTIQRAQKKKRRIIAQEKNRARASDDRTKVLTGVALLNALEKNIIDDRIAANILKTLEAKDLAWMAEWIENQKSSIDEETRNKLRTLIGNQPSLEN